MVKTLPLLMVLLLSRPPVLQAPQHGTDAAREVIERAIQALGGKNYLEVRSVHSYGRYFVFRKGRKGFARYWDWTQFRPVKSRFQLGKGGGQEIYIYNLELNQGWKQEGKRHVEEVTEKELQDFKRSLKHELDILLRERVSEEGISLFYYGPDDIAGAGEYEAVEFLDVSNDSVVVFFDRKTHLPAKLETETTDRFGIRHKREVEFYNWHEIQGVMTPLRVDRLLDGEISEQIFVEELVYNQPVPEDYFLKPVVEKK